MKRKMVMIFFALFLFFISISPNLAKGEEENQIFSLEIDGLWKPSDIKTHEFKIKNDYGEKCYLDSISFKNTLIKDVQNQIVYSLKQAEEADIIDAYDVSISINDQSMGEKLLFSGKLKELQDKDIIIPNSIYMDIDQEINFNITIMFDMQAGNEYQNKSYEFILFPKCHKIDYTIDNKDSTEKPAINDPKWRVDGFYDSNGNWIDTGYYDENGDWHYNGYYDEQGNWRIDGHYDEQGNWHNGGYYNKEGVWHQDSPSKDVINRVNKYFKTGDSKVTIIGYEILLLSCIFLIVARIRSRDNNLW